MDLEHWAKRSSNICCGCATEVGRFCQRLFLKFYFEFAIDSVQRVSAQQCTQVRVIRSIDLSLVEGEVMSLLHKIGQISSTAARDLEGQYLFFFLFIHFTDMVSVLEQTEIHLFADSFKMLFLWA